MDNDQWTNENDPDNFFVADDILRTLLNDRQEIKVGSSIYIIADERTIVEILNNDWATLQMYRQGNSAYEASPNFRRHISPGNPTPPTAAKPSNCIDSFVATRQADGRSFRFVPDITPDAGRTYSWDFGDGIVSSNREQGHFYARPGRYVVTLRVGGYCVSTSAQIVETSDAFCSASTFPTDALNFTQSNVGQSFTFTLASNYTSQYTYIWDFGNGDVTTYPAANRTTKFYQNYTSSGTLSGRLFIRNTQGCVIERGFQVNVPKEDCILPGFFARDVEFEEEYLPNKKFKYKLWATNAPFYHAVGAKTKNFEKRSGKWKDSKAPRVSSQVYGNVFYKSQSGVACANITPIDREDSQTNDEKAKTSIRLGSTFRLKQQSIRSKHYVELNGVRYYPNPSKRELEIK